MTSLLLDVGGTFIKGAVAETTTSTPVFTDRFEIPIDSAGSFDAISASLRAACSRVASCGRVAVAIPGPFDYAEGTFLMKHKFASVYGLSFRALAGIPDTVPVTFVHDVNCMLAGEIAYGAARDFQNAALVTLGTGLGFAVAVEGSILVAPSGSPEVGIWDLPWRDGILEDYVSSRGIRRLYSKELSVKDMADAARAGDIEAEQAFRYAGDILVQALEPILYQYDVECLLFGGQISRSYDLFECSLPLLKAFCPSLRHIGPVSDISNATFCGLLASGGQDVL